jgi:hypothetical protein
VGFFVENVALERSFLRVFQLSPVSITPPVLQGPGFNPRSAHVGFFLENVALERSFLRVFQLSPVSITPPVLQGPGFDPRSSHVGFFVENVALARSFLRVFQLSPVSITPPVLHTHFFIPLPPTKHNLCNLERKQQFSVFCPNTTCTPQSCTSNAMIPSLKVFGKHK